MLLYLLKQMRIKVNIVNIINVFNAGIPLP